jgi:hypothetical protein
MRDGPRRDWGARRARGGPHVAHRAAASGAAGTQPPMPPRRASTSPVAGSAQARVWRAPAPPRPARRLVGRRPGAPHQPLRMPRPVDAWRSSTTTRHASDAPKFASVRRDEQSRAGTSALRNPTLVGALPARPSLTRCVTSWPRSCQVPLSGEAAECSAAGEAQACAQQRVASVLAARVQHVHCKQVRACVRVGLDVPPPAVTAAAARPSFFILFTFVLSRLMLLLVPPYRPAQRRVRLLKKLRR